MVKLNLGAGSTPMDGWENLDRKTGDDVFPLQRNDVDEIRASHVLEHFSHKVIDEVLRNWVAALKPGGLLRIAVPDFEQIARLYLAGQQIPTEGYIMGGHTDADDRHGAIFDEESLGDLMRGAGLVGITRWVSSERDCSALPISLNLQGTKPPKKLPTCSAVLSLPRLAFTDNVFSCFEGLVPLGIQLKKTTGAFWGQCLERGIEEILTDDDPEWVLTLDYDTVFTRNDVQGLLTAAMRHPEADAIAPVQAHRTKPLPLMTMRGEDGKNIAQVEWDTFAPELTKIATAHFGLTLIKASKLKELQKPWFNSIPAPDGSWGNQRTDDDIYFWRQWEHAGNSLYLANRVPVGHAELMIRWPGRSLSATYQHPSEFWESGKPDGVWR